MNTTELTLIESERTAADALFSQTVLAGDGFMRDLLPGQVLRIVDLEGNQAADTLFFDTLNPGDHYSAVQTIAGQRNLYLTTGSVLRAESGKPLLEIVA